VIALAELRQMPLQEKLRMMEAIWDDIAREEESLAVPDWHKAILDERERLLADGKTRYIDWEDAKKQITEALE
jgi:putative addiction module component (TIGR02574 family)